MPNKSTVENDLFVLSQELDYFRAKLSTALGVEIGVQNAVPKKELTENLTARIKQMEVQIESLANTPEQQAYVRNMKDWVSRLKNICKELQEMHSLYKPEGDGR